MPYLLQSMAIVRQRLPQPPVHLAIIGEGELEAECREQVQNLGLAGCVHFLGFRGDALRWTGGCDLFVLSSLWEGHSITLLEAMGLGRPIVATDIKGNRETITHDHDGLLVPPADADSLADAIIALATDQQRARRLGQAGKKTFDNRFTEQIMKDNNWRVYQDVLTAKGLL